MIKCKIKDIVTLCSETLVPQKGVAYHLYSLPSFDDGMQREELLGEEILSNKFVVPDKCILFNKLNVRFKRVWRIDNADNNKLASTEFLPLIVDEDKVDFQYCYYLLISDSITKYLSGQTANTSGSHKRISPDDFLNIEVALPERTEQKKIGGFLSSIDKKIDVNRATNQKLEALTKHIYDYWFVQFDFPDENGKPYKSSGGAMVYNEQLKREIPKGWKTVIMEDLLDKVPSTKSFPSKLYKPDGEFAIIDQSPEYIIGYTDDRDNIIFKHPAIVFGDHSTNIKYVDFPFGRGADGTQIIYSKDSAISQLYLYHYLKATPIPNPGYQRHFKYVKEMIVPVPPKDIVDKFTVKTTAIYDMIKQNTFEIKQLRKLYSYMTPLLMAGQVSLK